MAITAIFFMFQVLSSTFRAKTPLEKTKLSVTSDENFVPKPSEDSSDDGKLYSIGDPSDNEQSSVSRSSETEEDDIEIEKPKPKRKRRRKQQSGERTAKRSKKKQNVTCSLCGEAFEGRVLLREHRKAAHPEGKVNTGVSEVELSPICKSKVQILYLLTASHLRVMW